MSKSIEFATFTQKADGGCTVSVDASDLGVIKLRQHSGYGTVASYKDPAKLRTLATKLFEAAKALEASQQLTFADLKATEFFRPSNDANAICYKTGYGGWNQTNGSAVGAIYPETPVIRLRATFVEEETQR